MLGIKLHFPIKCLYKLTVNMERRKDITCKSLSPFPWAYRSYSLKMLARLQFCNFLKHPMTTPLLLVEFAVQIPSVFAFVAVNEKRIVARIEDLR